MACAQQTKINLSAAVSTQTRVELEGPVMKADKFSLQCFSELRPRGVCRFSAYYFLSPATHKRIVNSTIFKKKFKNFCHS